MTGHAHGNHRLFEGRGAAHFNDVIDATATGQCPGCLTPTGVFAVVDDVLGAQPLEALQLLIAGGGGNHRGTGHFRELQGKD